ncbi:hypothetical protein SAMN05444354_10175 [Stigmatella aurantiaca]|uniref:Uncharacterized protein n=1 Tax=Stigmatella aurantiaca TaxID=41 RepID=A0A1H7FIB8_STIAU|nr:hypothetical protein [Stigmatella aurantiaca]SEK24192.1 hypothetical protein SAMN05444354_10175 [Stigmatella aurantiaca]
MGRGRGRWQKMVTAVLLAQAWGCSDVDPSPGVPLTPEAAPSAQVPSTPAVPATPPAASEDPFAPPEPPRALSCEDIVPADLGKSRSIALDGRAGREADCGPGTSDGAGFLVLMNSFRLGYTAWDAVSSEGVPTGQLIYGGDLTNTIVPQPRGFHVSLNAFSPEGLALKPYTSQGEALSVNRLTTAYELTTRLSPDPQGGALFAVWEPREGNTQALEYQFLDSTGVARAARTQVLSAPGGGRPLLTGVDTQGRGLLLWQSPGDGNTWHGQWVEWNGSAVTQPFPFVLPSVANGTLQPLAGGGLALRSNAGQWTAVFPSGQAAIQPAPAWLADHPGTQLVLIRGQQAHALIPPPATVEGIGCQPSLLLFTQDGTACGAVQFPALQDTCSGRQLNVGVDGTVVQYVETLVPPEVCDEDDACSPSNEKEQCAWRWWPGLLR